MSEPDAAPDAASSYGTVDMPMAAPTSPPPQADSGRMQNFRENISFREALSRVSDNIKQINTAPRELWIIFVLKFLSSYAYFAMALTMTIFLSQDFGLTDIEAGWSFGVYGMMATLFGFLCGWVIDFLGVRYSLIVGSFVGAISRLVICLTTSRTVALATLFTTLPFAEALGIPIMAIGVKRYTDDTNRTFAFSLFYCVMNIAAVVVGPLVDSFRLLFAGGVDLTLPLLGPVHLSSLRLVVMTASVASATLCIVAIGFVREVELDTNGTVTEFTPNRTNPLSETWATLHDRAFWRLLILTVLLIGVRLVFSHTYATMPKYIIRQFGEDAPYGLIFAINPFLIIFLVPIVALVTKHIASFPMILYGSFFAAASPFFICIEQSYLMVVLFMVLLSLGEAVYSPRVYEYNLQLSKRGAEGLYTSLATAPLFAVSLVVGGQSGWLLSTYMPQDGPHNGKMVWLIVGLTCMTSPILMWFVRDFIGINDERSQAEPTPSRIEAGADPDTSAAEEGQELYDHDIKSR